MNVNKLGLRSTSFVLATALALAPLESLAAPEAVAPTSGETPEGEAPVDGETPPIDGGEAPVDGEVPVDGETPPDGELPVEEPPAEEPPAEEPPAEEPPAEAEIEPPAPEVLGPLKPAEPTWGPKDQYPMNGKGMLITGGTVTGLGAAFIATSVLITRCDFDSALSCKLGDQRDFLVPLSVATTGLGLMLIGVGIGNYMKYKRWQNWTPEQTAVVPTMVPGGGGLAWVGKF